MSRRIAFCSDGTWEGTDGNTNVYKIFKAIVAIPGEQYPVYDDGVGADGTPIERLLGGAAGTGLFQKIKDGYSAISSVYEEGDEVFLFGFSRGAYTARSLAGMIAICGLPTKNPDTNLVNTAFEAYRSKDRRAAIMATLGGYGLVDAKLTMVGVWDTVGSLGIPALVGGVDPLLYGFLDTGLHPDVLNAYHAVSIDERRREFPATLWTGPFAAGQIVDQVYFCGVHGDVGGGYVDDSGTGTTLSDITLSWMMSKAQALGLSFDPAVAARFPSPIDKKYALDTKHESWSPLWLFPKSREIAQNAALANSVELRWQIDVTYRPPNLSPAGGLPGAGYDRRTVVA
ncbi:MAG: DUF2235 domain-containing protein [Bryobacteraceae bacterium]|jgi:uncharacterized protein (DUF2235 family)